MTFFLDFNKHQKYPNCKNVSKWPFLPTKTIHLGTKQDIDPMDNFATFPFFGWDFSSLFLEKWGIPEPKNRKAQS